ncbi:MAG: beta-glucosidase BglX [Clostridia bacterium]|nr:beta-glucosidase BglX [Clostridia bacterium]
MKKEELVDLLQEMTIEEKIGQLVQVTGEVFLMDNIDTTTGPLKDLNLSNKTLYQVGSILNIVGSEKIRKVQDEYLSKSRLKIPLLFMADIINGYRTVFPIPLAQGCSWDPNVVYHCTKVSIKEAGSAGASVNFSPMVDLVRDSRWGRVMESIGGEDPYLGQVFAKTMIQAYQGEDISKLGNVAACVKHFAAYGAVEGGRDYNTVDMSEREFRQYYLPAYKSAIENGAEMIMTSFNTINGVPASVNQWLLREVLRKELGFKGIVISDYSAIEETIAHGVSKDKKQAAYRAIMAGVDIDMMSNVYANHLKELIDEGKVPEEILNQSVMRVLILKNKLGLFENPYGNIDEEREKRILKSEENLQEARKQTAETLVLLKNEKEVLPLKKNQKIALIGPYGDNIAILGSWSIFSDKSKIQTLKEVFEKRMGTKNVLYAKGSEILREKEINQILSADGGNIIHVENEEEKENEYLQQAIEIAKQADTIVLAIGEHYRQSGEACSRANIEISEIQKRLLNELAKQNKKIVTVLFNGRPLVLKDISEKTDALLEVWFPGTEGANAIADVIFGEVNPSGKLTMSFPQATGQCPIYYNHYQTGRPHISNIRFASRYQDIPTQSFYPFGYGLSYSKFEYFDLKISSPKITENSFITVSIKVKNNSNRGGKEVVQLYIQDLVASSVRPVKELKGFKKEYFEAYEEKTITFEITVDMLKFWSEKLQYQAEKGEFKIFIGPNAEEGEETIFELV